MQKWKGEFFLLEIDANRLSDVFRCRFVIEQIVPDLKCHPERFPICFQGCTVALSFDIDTCRAHFATCAQEGSSLICYDSEIVILCCVELASFLDLKEFAFRHP